MRKPDDEPDLIAESRRRCGELERMLSHVHAPSSEATFTAASGQSMTVKIPSKLVAVEGTLSWRAHDFAALACDLFERKRIVPGAVIARSLMETTALFYLVYKKTVQALDQRSLTHLDAFLIRCMSGNRLAKGEPESPNILMAIQAIDKEPGCEKYADFYASLSEFAHPNALGSFHAYSSFDDESRAIWFGRNRGLTRGEDMAFTVVFALEVLVGFLARAKSMMPAVVALAKVTYTDAEEGS